MVCEHLPEALADGVPSLRIHLDMPAQFALSDPMRAQVILRWHIENGTIIIPKSVHAERQRENLDLFGFALTPEEHAQIDALDGPTRAGHDPMTFTYA